MKTMTSSSSKNMCRLCYDPKHLFELIELGNFPRSAQHMPYANELVCDTSITLSIIQCSSCGLVQTKNSPVSYYKDVITAASHSDASKENIKKEIKGIIKKYALQPLTALEIGSASGAYLEILREVGFDVEGVENNQDNVETSRKRNIKTHQGYLLDGLKLEKKYKFVAVNNFLEHQPDIKKFLSILFNLLEDDGLIYLSVPNLERIIEKHCLYEFVSDHLVYFTESTCQTAMAKAGFQVLEIYKKNNDNDIVVIAQKPQLLDLRGSISYVEDIISSLQKYVENLNKKNKRVCVWGAGHRALALMSISKLHMIEAVVDSASFKQGRFTPALHKKIISPETFIKGNFDAIIIMLPGSYGEQAKAYLDEQNYEGEVKIFEDKVISL